MKTVSEHDLGRLEALGSPRNVVGMPENFSSAGPGRARPGIRFVRERCGLRVRQDRRNPQP